MKHVNAFRRRACRRLGIATSILLALLCVSATLSAQTAGDCPDGPILRFIGHPQATGVQVEISRVTVPGGQPLPNITKPTLPQEYHIGPAGSPPYRVTFVRLILDPQDDGLGNWGNHWIAANGSPTRAQVFTSGRGWICVTVQIKDELPCQVIEIKEYPCFDGCDNLRIGFELSGEEHGPPSPDIDINYTMEYANGGTSTGTFGFSDYDGGVGIQGYRYQQIGSFTLSSDPNGTVFTRANTPAIINQWDAAGNKYCLRVAFGTDSDGCPEVQLRYVDCDEVEDPDDACCAALQIRVTRDIGFPGDCRYDIDIRNTTFAACDIMGATFTFPGTIEYQTPLIAPLGPAWHRIGRVRMPMTLGGPNFLPIEVTFRDGSGRIRCTKRLYIDCSSTIDHS